MSAVNGKKLQYKLGLQKEAGTFTSWIKTKATNDTRYIITNDGSSLSILYLYINSNNKLTLAVRDKANKWKEIAITSETINDNTWNFVGYSWKMNGGNLDVELYINDKIYTGSTSDFIDFSGGITFVGGQARGACSLNGQ